MRRTVSAFVIAVLVLGTYFTTWADAPGTHKLIVVTWNDIHYGNEKYEPAAWDEAYKEGLSLHPNVVVMCGDQMDNKCSRDEFEKRQEVFLKELGARLDRVGAPIVLALGNNDMYRNYQTDPQIMKVTTGAYARWLKRYDYLDELGNGVYPRTVGGFTWVSLNTQIFSPDNRYAGRAEQAARTLDWLEQRLTALPHGRPVVLVVHIPPSYDLWGGGLSWRAADLQRFGLILQRYSGPVVILAAHYHRNEVHGFYVPGRGPVPLLIAGSISFKYGNYPNWCSSVWTVGRGGGVQRFDWITHYPKNHGWDSAWSLVAPYAGTTYSAFVDALRNGVQRYASYMENLYAHNVDWRKWADDANIRALLFRAVAPPDIATRAVSTPGADAGSGAASPVPSR